MFGRPGARAADEENEMAKYLVLIYEDETQWATGAPGTEEALAQHWRFGTEHADAIAESQALQPTNTATSLVKGAGGGFTVTDGPFVETKEALGGFYLLEAADLDEAIALAKQIPAPFGGLEIRP